jgi:hypothetical protein
VPALPPKKKQETSSTTKATIYILSHHHHQEKDCTSAVGVADSPTARVWLAGIQFVR